jgi:hypothetical protein
MSHAGPSPADLKLLRARRLFELCCRETVLEQMANATRSLPSRITWLRQLAQVKQQLGLVAIEYLAQRA